MCKNIVNMLMDSLWPYQLAMLILVLHMIFEPNRECIRIYEQLAIHAARRTIA